MKNDVENFIKNLGQSSMRDDKLFLFSVVGKGGTTFGADLRCSTNNCEGANCVAKCGDSIMAYGGPKLKPLNLKL